MSSQLFYRNKNPSRKNSLTKHKAHKLSMDDLLMIVQGSSSKPFQPRLSNDMLQCKPIVRHTYKHQKLRSTGNSSQNSLLQTRNNSPFKMSLKNSISAVQIEKIKEYKFYYQIGFGAFGRVWKVSNKQTGKQLAMKQISKRKVIQKNNISSILGQKKILCSLDNPFIINIQSAFQDSDNLYLTMDYLRGADLRYHICYKERFSEKQVRFISSCIITSLQYIHSQRIIHKDIKPQNIVFEDSGYCRITDFGIAKYQPTLQSSSCSSQSSGTPVYMAPEILFKKDYSFQSDFYALGVIIHQLSFGKRPFDGKTRSQIREQIMNKKINLKESHIPQGWERSLADLINKLLVINPKERLGSKSIKDIKQHPFFEQTKWKKLQRKEIKPPFIPNVVCQTREYLEEISLFNEMNGEGKENKTAISKADNNAFFGYDYDKKKGTKKVTKDNYLKKARKITNKKLAY